jgi:hypothetical protein
MVVKLLEFIPRGPGKVRDYNQFIELSGFSECFENYVFLPAELGSDKPKFGRPFGDRNLDSVGFSLK